jgi:hypothetical protein
MVIDAHNHIGGPDKGDGRSQGPDEIIARMDEAGIGMAVVFPFNEAEPGVSFSRANDKVAAYQHAHPDRLIGFCRLDPNYGASAVDELTRCVRELGLKGVKLHPTSQRFGLGDPALAEILSAAQELRVPVVFDTGKAESPPMGVAELAGRFPRLSVIMAHMNLLDETMEAAGQHPNVYVGTTGYFNLNGLARAVHTLGAHRFVSGSDSPYIRMTSEKAKFDRIELTDEERGWILGGNIARILGMGGF